ncbi:Rho-GTPase-activating protein 8 [Coemansia sp. RSA 988]|nr:Rho-GTPase-activating protein 8 [Coemansia sp. RSA 988]
MLKFENSFWDNPGAGHQPRYERGPQQLYEKLEQGAVESDELLAFFRERVAIEEAYANSLRKLSERKLQNDGFGRDEGATLKTAYRGLLTECLAMSEAHADLAIELQSSVVVPLRSFSNEHRARVRASWKLVDDTIRRASTELAQVDRNHRVYTQKASAAEQLRLQENPDLSEVLSADIEIKTRPSAIMPTETSPVPSTEDAADADVALQRQLLSAGSSSAGERVELPTVRGSLDVASIVLGNVALTRHEFHVMVQRMQTEVPQHDVRFGILGTFRGLISGESLAGWWCTNYPTVVRDESEAVLVGQSILDQGYLRFMGRGSQFQSRANAYYQWKRAALDFHSDDEADSDDEPLGARQAHMKGMTSYERARHDADEASRIYRESVQRAEMVRTDLEEQLTNYLDTMEVWELNRLMNVKSTLGEYARVSRRPVQAALASGDRLDVYEESIKPQQDIQWGIENYGTGRFAPCPILFRPFGLSSAEFQIFGVALDEQLLVSHKSIPLFPAKTLSLISKQARDMAPEDRYAIWTTRALLRNIHDLRNTINRNSRVTLRQLRAFDLPVVANALVLYLLELPMPLCPEELYGPLRALYSARNEKSSVETLQAIRGLLEGISYAHIETIKSLFGTLSELIEGDESEAKIEFVKVVSKRLGPVIMRGKESIGISISRIPETFAADLIEHYNVILADIESKRPFKPIPHPPKIADHYEADLTTGLTNTHLDASAAAAAAAVAASVGLGSVSARVSGSGDSNVPNPVADVAPDTGRSASKRSSGVSNATDTVTPSSGDKNGGPLSVPASAGSARAQVSFDEDERLVDNILEGANDVAAGGENSMDYFLKDEDSDGSDDDNSGTVATKKPTP